MNHSNVQIMNKMKIVEHNILKDIKIKTQYRVQQITYKPEIELVRLEPFEKGVYEFWCDDCNIDITITKNDEAEETEEVDED